jgi:peptidoglycan hydrolase-like protein with peptidoglycan-binding domain
MAYTKARIGAVGCRAPHPVRAVSLRRIATTVAARTLPAARSEEPGERGVGKEDRMPWIATPGHGSQPRAHVGVLVGALLVTGLAGCGGSGGEEGTTAVKAAEARVSAKDKALADAKAALADKSAEFCDAAQSYIVALDRYGDLLNETAPTVGDVKAAGTDLEQPREEVMSEAEAAVAAQQAVTDAKQELAEAEADLAAAKNPGSAAPSSQAGTSGPKPLAPTAAVNRVKQAESEFTAVQQGIGDETPLSQASQQFNAAVVAVEMSWLRLFSDAGCLTDEQQVAAEVAVRDYTTALQQSLLDAGYYDGEVDGVYGPATVAAIEALQQAHGLPSTGTLDKGTAAALQADLTAQGGALAQEAVASTAAVQQTLNIAGFWDGPVDGEWTPELTEALKDFQTELGVKPTGTVDAATIAALEKAIADLSAAVSASASPTTSESPTSPPSSSTGTSVPPTTSPSTD